jgi:hypothetical protein
MLTRSKSQIEKLIYIDEIEAFARRKSAIKLQRQKEGESSSSFSSNSTPSANLIMAEEVHNPLRVVLGDYVIPQGSRNRSAIVLSPIAQQMEIKPYWYNLILTNQFTGKDH